MQPAPCEHGRGRSPRADTRCRLVAAAIVVLAAALLLGACTPASDGNGAGTVAPVTSVAAPGTSVVPNGSIVVPSTPVGTQLEWLLALSHLPLSTAEITTHFDASFLGQVSPAHLNAVLATIAAEGVPSLQGLSRVEPRSLVALVSFGTLGYDITFDVDTKGLIDGLVFALPPPKLATSWSGLDSQLESIAPGVGLLAAEVDSDGLCSVVHSLSPSTPRPLGSMFKLFVLGALADAIRAHTISWNQKMTVTAAAKIGGSGTLQSVPDGTRLTVEQVALKMISVSDNTAAEMLLALVGRAAVEAQVRKWASDPALDIPFLTVKELFALHLAEFPTLADHYLALDAGQRAAYLTSTVDKVATSDEVSATGPRDINSIEWFASPADLCRAFSGLAALEAEPGLSPIATILSANNGGIGLSTTTWPRIWFKGGSEPGVLTLGYLARDSSGRTYVVIALTENPAHVEGPEATNGLAAVVLGAFGLLR